MSSDSHPSWIPRFQPPNFPANTPRLKIAPHFAWVLAPLPLCAHARRARARGTGGTRAAAAQQELRERPTISSCSAPQPALGGPPAVGQTRVP